MARVQKKTIAAALGISPGLVSRYSRQGMPVCSIEQAAAWKATNIRPRAPSPGREPPPAAFAAGVPVTSFHVARTLREAAEAKLAQLKLAELTGELVRRSDVEKGAARAMALLREALQPVPGRVAADPGNATQREAIEQRLRAEIERALAATTNA